MNNRTGLLSGLLLTLPLTQPAFAAETADTVIVTATRTAQTVDDTLASVSVITREDIEASGAQDVIDLLRLQAGVDVTRSGGPGTNTDVYLRGTSNKQSLILIDGMRAASATTGGFAWSKLNLADVERIEIVRGPNASLYGSDAIGGVIQIFTRRNRAAHLRGEVGSYESKRFEAGIGGGTEAKYSLNVSARAAEGFSATNPKSSYYNADIDGYRQRSASGNLRFSLNKKARVTLSGWYSDGYTEYDQGINNSTNATLDARLTHATTARWHQTFRLGWAADDLDTESSYPSFIRTRRWTADWKHDITLSETALLSLGLNAIRDRGEKRKTSSDFDKTRDTNAAYGLLQTAFGRHDLQFSARVDDYDTFGTQTTGSAAWGLNVSDSLRMTALAGTAFRAPTINELYWPGYGNANLKPETSLNIEIGLRYQMGPARRFSANLYRNDIDNLIGGYPVQNIDKARIDGLELTYQFWKARWSLQATATMQRAIDANTGQVLELRPREKVSLTLRRKTANGGNYGLEWLFAGKRYDDVYSVGRVTLDPYHLINLSARTPLDKGLWLEGRVENLLATDYELIYGYNTPGLSAYLGVKYDFGG